jgi:hypothetical protein
MSGKTYSKIHVASGIAGGIVFGLLLSAACHDGTPRVPATANELRSDWAARCIDKGTAVGQTANKELISSCSDNAMKIILAEKPLDSIPGSYGPSLGSSGEQRR